MNFGPYKTGIATAIVLAGLALTSFVVVTAVVGQNDPPPRNEKLVKPLDEDDAKPRATGKFGEITIYSQTQGPPYTCSEDVGTIPDYAPARGTALAVNPSYLPPGVVEYEKGGVNTCGPVVIAAARTWLATNVGGPEIRLRRFLRPQPWVNADAPSDRISTATVAGHTATIIRHVVQDGDQVRGNSGVFWADARNDGLYLVTAVYGDQISIEELVKVAEGIR